MEISISIIRRFHRVILGRTFTIDILERRRVRSRLIFCWFLRRAGKPGRARDECGRSGVTGVWSASRAGGTRGDGASGPCPNGARPVAEPAIFFPLGRHRVPLPSCSPLPLAPGPPRPSDLPFSPHLARRSSSRCSTSRRVRLPRTPSFSPRRTPRVSTFARMTTRGSRAGRAWTAATRRADRASPSIPPPRPPLLTPDPGTCVGS